MIKDIFNDKLPIEVQYLILSFCDTKILYKFMLTSKQNLEKVEKIYGLYETVKDAWFKFLLKSFKSEIKNYTRGGLPKEITDRELEVFQKRIGIFHMPIMKEFNNSNSSLEALNKFFVENYNNFIGSCDKKYINKFFKKEIRGAVGGDYVVRSKAISEAINKINSPIMLLGILGSNTSFFFDRKIVKKLIPSYYEETNRLTKFMKSSPLLNQLYLKLMMIDCADAMKILEIISNKKSRNKDSYRKRISPKIYRSSIPHRSYTALQLAAICDAKSIMRYFLEELKFNPNSAPSLESCVSKQDKGSVPAIFLAIENYNNETLLVLLNNGAKVHISCKHECYKTYREKDENKVTPIGLAKGKIEYAKKYFKEGKYEKYIRGTLVLNLLKIKQSKEKDIFKKELHSTLNSNNKLSSSLRDIEFNFTI